LKLGLARKRAKVASFAFVAALQLALSLLTTSATAAENKEQLLEQQFARWAPMKIRLAKNKHIGFRKEGDKLQACISLSDLATPYVVTLGWFTRKKQSGVPETDLEQEFTDELGEAIPMPGFKLKKAGLDDADRHALMAFDTIADGDVLGSLGDLKNALKQAPSSPRLHNNLGVVLALSGKEGQALQEFNEAIKEKPDYAIAIANRGWLELSMSQPEAALKDGEDALKAASNLHAAERLIVRSFLRLNQPKDAMNMLDILRQGWAGDYQDQLLLGETQLANKEYAQAKETLTRLSLSHPHDLELELITAKAMEQAGDLDNAIKKAREATGNFPDSASAHLALGRYLEMNRDYKAALLQYERVLELKPSESLKASLYGPYLRTLVNLNELPEADKLSKKWAQENAERADCHFNRAWVLTRLNSEDRLTEAVSEYRKAIASDPKQTSVHYNLALLLHKLKRNEEARFELEHFVKSAPDDPDANQARQLLSKLSSR
jgi:tetratricopeptide (TPR) repeat protein